METNRLLIGCNTIQMWSYTLDKCCNSGRKKVQFTINNSNDNDDIKSDELKWKKIWETKYN